ncbi:hypothetical protein [Paenibacillus pini]|uniref:Phage protein n=1 Tax=Paenibacillus pini JCM 16418 TaxID=1236976 RepID=W7YIR7_9BACL|nr:hypothetical protein [Paenibacillus pini]GAF10790.1 phage protein [Paenibacillus pini JCM 16418]
MRVLFNRNPLKFGNVIEQPTLELVKNTPQLWNASLEDALKYGGELTKSAIGAMNLKFDCKHIIVDTKIHMLMKGFYPAIPSWHTDGVPRGEELKPDSKGDPNITAQENMSPSRFHLLVTGEGCLTDFVTQPTILDVPNEPTTELYRNVHDQIENQIDDLSIITIPSCTVVEWDWWNIHRGVKAQKHEWRYLIRATETDHMKPQIDLRQILRTQIQVYVPESFGW